MTPLILNFLNFMFPLVLYNFKMKFRNFHFSFINYFTVYFNYGLYFSSYFDHLHCNYLQNGNLHFENMLAINIFLFGHQAGINFGIPKSCFLNFLNFPYFELIFNSFMNWNYLVSKSFHSAWINLPTLLFKFLNFHIH